MATREMHLRQSEITRALRAAQAAGLTIAEYVTTKNGVRVVTVEGATGQGGRSANPWDEVLDDGEAR